ncbi:MAG: hypothetical protein LBS41_03355 [Streptococcaceae bacterium]|jgi:hypothetical protein|nr:hypothetical protein [Streptococcaceae bacterium]
MTKIDWIFIVAAIFIAIFIFCFGYALYACGRAKKEARYLQVHPLSSSAQQNLALNRNARDKGRYLLGGIISLLLLTLTIGGVGYFAYLETTQLKVGDLTAVSNGYYYDQDIKALLSKAKAGNLTEGDQKQLSFLTDRLAAYSVLRANENLSERAQLTLNHYYTALTDLGINVHGHAKAYGTDPKTQQLIDHLLDRVAKREKDVLTSFDINAQTLAKRKE